MPVSLEELGTLDLKLEEMARMGARLRGLEEAASSSESRFHALEAENNALRQQVEAANAKAKALEGKVATLEQRASSADEQCSALAKGQREAKHSLKRQGGQLVELTRRVDNASEDAAAKVEDRVQAALGRLQEQLGSLTIRAEQVVLPAVSEGDEEQQGPTPLDQAFRALESSVGGVEASLTSVGDRTSRLEEEVAGKANSSEVDRIEGTVLEHQQVVEELTTDMSSLLHKAEAFVSLTESAGALEESARRFGERLGMLGEDTEARITEARLETALSRKYDQIVGYLQDAITATAKDEEEFQRVSSELQQSVNTLIREKADRADVVAIREAVLADGNLRDQLDNIRLFLDAKVNREEFDSAIQHKTDRNEFREAMTKAGKALEHALTRQVESLQGMGALGGSGGPALRGAHSGSSTLCLSCNARLVSPERAQRAGSPPPRSDHAASHEAVWPLGPAPTPSPSRGEHDSGAASQRRQGSAPASRLTVFGPGGPALGGGFQVRSVPRPDSRGRPAVDPASRIVQRPATALSRSGGYGGDSMTPARRGLPASQHGARWATGGGSWAALPTAGGPAASPSSAGLPSVAERQGRPRTSHGGR